MNIIESIMSNEIKYKMLSENGKKTAKKYDINNYIMSLLNLYNDSISLINNL